MKKSITILFFIISFTLVQAQKTYTVNSETLELTTEVNGTIELLSTIDNGLYRFFVKKGTEIIELKNTKDASGNYKEEYKDVLKSITENTDPSVDNVKLTIGSLKRFLDTYNKTKDSDYIESSQTSTVNFRLGAFAGITNHPFVQNISNSSYPQLALELEIFGDTGNPRHSGIFQFRQTLGGGGDFVTTELSLGYRFRFLRKEGFNLFVQNRFASLNFNNTHFAENPNEIGDSLIEIPSETIFDVPLIFGIGADIKISDRSYVSIIYDSLFGINTDDADKFSGNILVGYKFKL